MGTFPVNDFFDLVDFRCFKAIIGKLQGINLVILDEKPEYLQGDNIDSMRQKDSKLISKIIALQMWEFTLLLRFDSKRRMDSVSCFFT